MKRTSLAALMGAALSSAYASAAILTSGHVDFIGIGYEGGLNPEDGEFHLHSHVEEGDLAGEYEPGDLTVQVSTTSLRPAGAAWDLSGVASGQSYYTLPETEIEGQPFVGIGAEELNPAEWTSDITITLTGASGSGIAAGGVFSMAQVVSGVPTFFMSTLGGISAADVYSMDLDVDSHAHFLWGFTEEGTYDLTFQITGTHAVDGAKSATATYSFSVIPEPSSALLGAIGALGLLRRRRN